MIVEERNYTMVPGGVPRYLDQWQASGRAVQVAHLGEPLGVYTVEIGPLNTLVYLWRFSDLGDRAGRRAPLTAGAGVSPLPRGGGEPLRHPAKPDPAPPSRPPGEEPRGAPPPP